MALYFFDIDENGTAEVDAFGVDLDGVDAAREQAAALLPHIAREKAPDGGRYTLTCTVRDGRRPIYRSTLTYEGRCLMPDDPTVP